MRPKWRKMVDVLAVRLLALMAVLVVLAYCASTATGQQGGYMP